MGDYSVRGNSTRACQKSGTRSGKLITLCCSPGHREGATTLFVVNVGSSHIEILCVVARATLGEHDCTGHLV